MGEGDRTEGFDRVGIELYEIESFRQMRDKRLIAE